MKKYNLNLYGSQHHLIERKSCVTNLVAFWNRVTVEVDEGGASDIIYLDLCRAFVIVLYSTFVSNQGRQGSDRWTKNLWVGSLQGGIVVPDSMSRWRPAASDAAQRSELEHTLTALSVSWTGGSRAFSESSGSTELWGEVTHWREGTSGQAGEGGLCEHLEVQ